MSEVTRIEFDALSDKVERHWRAYNEDIQALHADIIENRRAIKRVEKKMATKDDLKNFATKDDIALILKKIDEKPA